MGCSDVIFQRCKWTPDEEARPKWTRLRTNITELQSLSGPCRLKHRHLGWGVLPNGQFAAAGESEYPLGMCKAIISCLKLYFQKQGYVEPLRKQLTTADKSHWTQKATSGHHISAEGKEDPRTCF